MLKGGDSEQEADCIYNVRFPTAIKTSDCIELGVKVTDGCADRIGFEPIQDNLYDMHDVLLLSLLSKLLYFSLLSVCSIEANI